MEFEVIDKETQYAVIGLGRFGSIVAATLANDGAQVIAVDRDEAIINSIKDKQLYAFALDSSNEDSLREAGVDAVDCAIVCIGDDMVASILATLLMKKFKIPQIIARANTGEHSKILKLIGVTQVIEPEVETGQKLVKKLIGQGGFVVSFEQIWKEHAIVEIKANKAIIGKTLTDLNLREKFEINVIAIKRSIERLDDDYRNVIDFEIDEVPNPHEPISEGSILVLIGKRDSIKHFNNQLLRGLK